MSKSSKNSENLCIIASEQPKLPEEVFNVDLKTKKVEIRKNIDFFSEKNTKKAFTNSDLVIEMPFIEAPQVEMPNIENVEALTNKKLISPNEKLFPDEFHPTIELKEVDTHEFPIFPLKEEELSDEEVIIEIVQKTEEFLPVKNEERTLPQEVDLTSKQPSIIFNSEVFKISDISDFKNCSCSFEHIIPALIIPPSTCMIFESDILLLDKLVGFYERVVILSVKPPTFVSKTIIYRSIPTEKTIFAALKPFIFN